MANASENSLRNACYKNRFRVENSGTNAGNLELGTTIVGLVTTAGADSASVILGGGSASYPVTTTTADKNFLAFYTESTATSGSARCQYNRLYVSGSGGAGDAVRNFLTCETNTPNTSSALTGTHSSLNFGSSAGNTYGTLGCATRSTLHIPDRGLTGSATALQAEIYCDGASGDVLGPTGTQNGSFIRFSLGGNATGIASIEDNANLFYLDGFTSASGNVYYGNTLRISVAGTNKYLVLSDAENSLTVDVSGVIYDDSSLSFGDSSDVTFTWAAGGGFGTTCAANNTVWSIGNGTNSFDMKVYGSASANYLLWDASDNAIEFAGAARLDFSGMAASALTNGSIVTTGSTWIDNTAAGGTAFKLLCSSSAASGDFATFRIRARSDADSTGGVIAGNFSASANIAEYADLYAVQGYAQPGANAQTGAGNIICGVYSCTDLTATGSSGRDWSTWTDTHMAAKAAAGSYLHRLSHNGTVAADGCWTIYGGGRLPVLINVEDATPGFVSTDAGTYSSADGYLAIKINGSDYRIPYFAAVD